MRQVELTDEEVSLLIGLLEEEIDIQKELKETSQETLKTLLEKLK